MIAEGLTHKKAFQILRKAEQIISDFDDCGFDVRDGFACLSLILAEMIVQTNTELSFIENALKDAVDVLRSQRN